MNQQQLTTLALGMPDDRMAKCFVDAQGQPQIAIANHLQLPPDFMSTIREEDQLLWFPRANQGEFSVRGPIVNCCAEFDTFRKALADMRQWVPRGAVVFNHPDAVTHAASVQLRDKLNTIECVSVPKFARLRPRHPDEFRSAVRHAKMEYPLRIQLSANSSNQPEVIIRNENDWKKIAKLDWPRKRFVITQLKKTDLAQHVRIRVTVVGKNAEQVIFPFAYADTAMTQDPNRRVPMEPARFRKIVTQVARQVHLDFWTVEFSFRSSQEVCLEYLWPGLPLAGAETSANLSDILWKKSENRLAVLLNNPQQWRWAAVGAGVRQQ